MPIIARHLEGLSEKSKFGSPHPLPLSQRERGAFHQYGAILVQYRLIIQTGVGLIAVLLAVCPSILEAQDPFLRASPSGYTSNGQPQSGNYPVTGYQPSVVPYQPTMPIRPDGFPEGTAPQSATGAPAYGPTYQPGQPQVPGRTMQASYVGQLYPPCQMPAPAQLCEGAQWLGRVGNDVILTSDVLIGIDDMMSRARGKIPPEKFAEQRAALVQEVTAGIREFNAHYNDPDPTKAMSPSNRALINQLVRQQIDVKLLYQDFRKTIPKEAAPAFEENINRYFEEAQLKLLMKREKVVSRADLESALRAKGSSLDREKRIFMEQIAAQNWVQQQVKGGKDDEEVTHEEMLTWYQAHLKDFEKPAKARWEELMIAFSNHPNRDEAYAAVAALGNRVLAGASLADAAKSASEGPTARQGGQREWTHTGSLSSENLNQEIFRLPVGQLSQILESENGFHIIRVVERQELIRTSFLDAQKEVKENIQKERYEKRYKEFVEKLRVKYPVWTVFDNALQQPMNSDEEDRYSTQ